MGPRRNDNHFASRPIDFRLVLGLIRAALRNKLVRPGHGFSIDDRFTIAVRPRSRTAGLSFRRWRR
jgi:hypothetical protein